MNPIVNFLDCGCAIHANGHRDICPSCASPSVVTVTAPLEHAQALEARLERAEGLIKDLTALVRGEWVDKGDVLEQAQSFLAEGK